MSKPKANRSKKSKTGKKKSRNASGKGRPSSPAVKKKGTATKKKASLKVEPLEPRILLSATWVDADPDCDGEGPAPCDS